MQFTTPNEVLAILAATVHQVKIIRADSPIEHVTAERAAQIFRSGRFTGHGSTKRIRSIREVATRHLPWRVCYRTLHAAVLPPSAEYLSAMESGRAQ